MKRKGFTLLEILLTISIIGVLAAVLLRVITAVMPDVGKAKFLKAYSTARTVISEIISDTTLYPDDEYMIDTEGTEMKLNPNYGFANTVKPPYGLYNETAYSGSCKLPNIFADRLNMDTKGTCLNVWYHSPREGVSYKFIKDGDVHKIAISAMADNNIVFGYAVVANDGDVSCENAPSKNYCETMLELRQGR